MDELGLIATEQTLLGACVSAGICPPIPVSDFAVVNHQRIAKAMAEIERGGGIPDIYAVGLWVLENYKGELSVSDVNLICEAEGSEKNIPMYARMVQEHANARRMKNQAATFLAELGSPNGKSLAHVASEFRKSLLCLETPSSGGDDTHTMRMGIPEMLSQIESRMKNKSRVPGISTGFEGLDRITCGMWPQDVWVLAARPGQGKTALSLNITRHVAGEGRHVLWFSLDMSRQGLWERMIATESGINLAKIRSGNLDGRNFKDITDASAKLMSLPITIIDKPCTELDIMRHSKAIAPRFIVVDFLTKIKPSAGSGNANYDYGLCSKLLKNLAKELDIPVLLLCQLNRTNERESRPPREYDLRDSGEIEQDADTIIFIHSKDKALRDRDLIIAKQRQGELAVLKFEFNGGIQRFSPRSG